MDAAPNFSHDQQQHLAGDSIAHNLLSDPDDTSDDEAAVRQDENEDRLPQEYLARRVHRPSFGPAGARLLLAPRHAGSKRPVGRQSLIAAVDTDKTSRREDRVAGVCTAFSGSRGWWRRVASRRRDGSAPQPTDPPPPADVDIQFHSAVESSIISTSVQRESRILAASSLPLILTFLLQRSLTFGCYCRR